MDDRALVARLSAGPASGAELARDAGLTRAAVWKQVQGLRAAGLAIAATPARGYALADPPELLDPATILAQLGPDCRQGLAGLDVAWSLDSTNSELLRRPAPAQGVAVLLSERQTGGRGRRGRGWASPLAANIYLSLSRRFSAGLARLPGLGLVAGVASAEALHALGFTGVRLKWPNDLVVADGDGLRKLGGLLVEGGGEAGGPARAVLGLGLNVAMPAVGAAAIDQAWTDLRALGGDQVPSRNRVVAMLLRHLLPALSQFDEDGLEAFLPRYARFDAIAGRVVTLLEGGRACEGEALGLAPDGALRVRVAGQERRVHAGEVSVRAAA
jgi:BirA family biotin operon repressor/biotin-[acetyl-CoA-carboxylase] ligase